MKSTVQDIVNKWIKSIDPKVHIPDKEKGKLLSLLSRKEAEHKREMENMLQDIKKNNEYGIKRLKKLHEEELIHVQMRQARTDAKGLLDIVEKLKQQHREQLEGLKMEEIEFYETEKDEGYDQVIKEINSKIDTLLETITTE